MRHECKLYGVADLKLVVWSLSSHVRDISERRRVEARQESKADAFI